MAELFNIGNQTINTEELMPLLTTYGILPHLLQEIIIDKAIAQITCTPEELATASHKFWKQHQITNSVEHQNWLQQHNLNETQF
jgi:hypothetical protein